VAQIATFLAANCAKLMQVQLLEMVPKWTATENNIQHITFSSYHIRQSFSLQLLRLLLLLLLLLHLFIRLTAFFPGQPG